MELEKRIAAVRDGKKTEDNEDGNITGYRGASIRSVTSRERPWNRWELLQ